ncbi:MAG: mercuric reductase [Vicinamibacteria bacterium]|nr:mercuric reductase [Vicinamibacteria bacterium]
MTDSTDALLARIAALAPADPHNRRLLSHVHPPAWANPQPAEVYNLVVVGAGTAGLVAAAGAAGLGARVALVERDLMGGDCLNVGCVPSKALLRAARAIAEVKAAGLFGIEGVDGAVVDFPKVMERLRRLRADIAPHDSAERFRSLGIDVFLGDGRFTGRDRVEVAGRTLRFRRALIATGGRAKAPDLPGLAASRALTNETVFSLTALPRRLLVIGGGPIGCELAQAFARFGSQVTLVQSAAQVLDREDPEAAALVAAALRQDGVELVTGAAVQAVSRDASGCHVKVKTAAGEQALHAEEVLVAVGRAPNIEDLGLEAAGVAHAPTGVTVDDFLRTTNPAIYASGDVCSRFKFTHAADALSRIVLRNALFFGRERASALTIPWCTYTSPELAHVGLTESDALAAGHACQAIRVPLEQVDRARLDGDTGLLKVVVAAGSDRILGATLVAPDAGNMISELTLAMTAGVGLGTIARTIHPYPTQGEVIKRAADAWNKTRLTPRVKQMMNGLLAWRR